MPLVIVGRVVVFLLVAIQEEVAIVEVHKEVSNQVLDLKVQTAASF